MELRKRRIDFLKWLFVPIVFAVVFVRPSWALNSYLAFSLELLGYLFLLSGLTIRIWCTLYIGGRKTQKLITAGPYSICRNPLYIGTFLLSIGIGLCFENLLVLLLVPAIIIPVHFITVLMEEKHLKEKFGSEYLEYQKKVPRFWPRFSAYHSPEFVEVNIKAIRRIAMDTLGVLLLPEVEDLLELLHNHGILPVLWYFPH